MKTRSPPGVNFNRFAPTTFASIFPDSFLAPRSTIEIVPSLPDAVHNPLPSGDTSNPSEPTTTGTIVWSQSTRGLAPGGAVLDGVITVSSKMLTVPEDMFVV